MGAVTDQSFNQWKAQRIKAAEGLTTAHNGVDAFLREPNNRNSNAFDQVATDLEVKWDTYEKIHDKIVGRATQGQMEKDDYAQNISLEHEQLILDQQNAFKLIKNAAKQVATADAEAEKNRAREERIRQEGLVKQQRITNIISTLTKVTKTITDTVDQLDQEARGAQAFAELAAFHVKLATQDQRLKLMEDRTKEVTTLDPSLFEEHETNLVQLRLTVSESRVTMLNRIRDKVLASEHKEALLALYPTLRPVVPSPPGSIIGEQEMGEASSQSGIGVPDLQEFASTLVKGLVGKSVSQSVKKQDPPKFHGSISEYPRWKKNWKQIMAENNFKEAAQLRYLIEAMPVKNTALRSRLGNCDTMENAWKVMELEYGDNEELLRDRMSKLSAYQPPKHLKSDLGRFKDLMATWREIREDLRYVGLMHKMDHDLTFREFTRHLEKDSHRRWISFRSELQVKNKLLTKPQIFDSWLDVEVSVLKDMDYVDPHSEYRQKPKQDDKPDKDTKEIVCFACGVAGHKKDACKSVDKGKKCNNCGLAGHIAKACRKGKSKKPGITNAGGQVNAKCPLCSTEHHWRTREGEERVSTRMGNCPKYMSETVDKRAQAIEKAGGCVRCLDFTGQHKHPDCRYQGRCGVCQRNHHTSLHGTSINYVDCSNRLLFGVSDDEETVPGLKENNNRLDEVQSVPGSAEQILGDAVADGTLKEALTGGKQQEGMQTNKSKADCNWKCHTGERGNGPVIPSDIDSRWRRKAPTHSEIHQATVEASNTMFLAERAHVFDIRDNKSLANIFHDIGSNVSYITEACAARLGLIGTPKQLNVMHTGNQLKTWNTKVYRVSLCGPTGQPQNITCYSVESISGDLEMPDLSRIEEVFPGYKLRDKLHRATGAIDILLSTTYLELYPKEVEYSMSARLYRSTLNPENLVIAGCHAKINLGTGDALSEEAKVNRNVHILPDYIHTNNAGSVVPSLEEFSAEDPGHNLTNHAGITMPELEFWKGEEMGVSQPKRCLKCRGCTKCTHEAQNISRREGAELAQIREGMELKLDENDPTTGKITFKYPETKSLDVLRDNMDQAVGFQSKLERDLELEGRRGEYNTQFYEYVDNGVFPELSEAERAEWKGAVNYVVHHHVIKTTSQSTKLRIVSNSSMGNRKAGGVSPNQLWGKGADMLRPIIQCQCLLRGLHCVCVYDLKRAYNSVYTTPREKHVRRMVWRRSSDEPWKIYCIDRMHFGDVPSSCGLEVAKEKTAEAGSYVCPESASMITLGYVDDGLGGGRKELVEKMIGNEVFHPDGEITYDGTVQKIMAHGGFTVKIMVRNGENREVVLEKFGGMVLGLRWDAARDKIIMRMPVNFSEKDRRSKSRKGPAVDLNTIGQVDEVELTKEELLSQIASTYDTLGLLTPITLKVKLLMQKVVLANIGWKEKIPEDLMKEVREALRMMVELGEVEFDRTFLGNNWEAGYDIVAFFDGANPASAGVMYALTPIQNPSLGVSHDTEATAAKHQIVNEVRLIMSKARVTPTGKKAGEKKKSTPRTELRGLLILSRLITTFLKSMIHKPREIHIFGDSQTVIGTISSTDKVLDIWVGNRVDEICEAFGYWQEAGVKVNDIEHWPGVSNIADLCTRGDARKEDVLPGSPWQAGPPELQFHRSTWPTTRDFCRIKHTDLVAHAGVVAEKRKNTNVINSGEEELRKQGATELLNLYQKVNEVIKSCGSYKKIVHVLCRALNGAREYAPTVKQLRRAEHLMYMAASSKTNKDNFKRFRPVMVQGVLVTEGGRLGQLPMIMLTGQPRLPLLDVNNPLSKIIMVEAHEIDHFRSDTTLERSRRRAWIAQGAKLSRRVCNDCLWCRSNNPVKLEQAMGLIHDQAAIMGSQVWARTHVDMFGPYRVRSMVNSRAYMKVWVVLMVCSVTGAIHTELLAGASTRHFLTEWEKFVDVRGRPDRVISDPGTNFKSKDNSAGANLTDVDWKTVEKEEARHNTQWEFVPTGAQFRNSHAERRVKILKRVLQTVLATTLNPNNKIMHNYSQFQGIIRRIANVANDRPIDLKVVNGDYCIPVTVNHLLMGRNRGEPAKEVEIDMDECDAFLMQHEYLSEIERLWWSAWRTKAVKTLIPFHAAKDAKRCNNLQPGDVVIWLKEGKISASYRLARVIEAKPSERDQLVRTVTVAYLKKNVLSKAKAYTSKDFEHKTLAVQSLALLVTAEEVERKYWKYDIEQKTGVQGSSESHGVQEKDPNNCD